MKVLQFPTDAVFTRDGQNVFQNMVTHFDKWEKEGRITHEERNDIVGGLYSVKALIEKSAGQQVKEWFKNKAKGWYRELDEFSTGVETIPFGPEDL